MGAAMKEIEIEKPTRIVNLHDGRDYIRGLYARVETPRGNYVATWEHRPQAGCVLLEAEGGDGGEMRPCRNAVLIASLCHFQKTQTEWPHGCEIPVLPECEAEAFLKAEGIPDDAFDTFRIMLALD